MLRFIVYGLSSKWKKHLIFILCFLKPSFSWCYPKLKYLNPVSESKVFWGVLGQLQTFVFVLRWLLWKENQDLLLSQNHLYNIYRELAKWFDLQYLQQAIFIWMFFLKAQATVLHSLSYSLNCFLLFLQVFIGPCYWKRKSLRW